MKRQLLITILLLIMIRGYAQETSEGFFEQLTSEAVIISEKGLVRGHEEIQTYLSGFNQSNGAILSYNKALTKKVNAGLEYEIGEIETKQGIFSVMLIKKTGQTSGLKIELLTIYPKMDANDQQSAIDQARKKWMELCNAHKASELVSQLYTPEAYYFNRGRLLQGTEAISQEYGYMNNPNYSLKLTPLHLVFVAPDIAYEIGQCSGSYSLPYMLLWEKQKDGKWQVLMDSNY